MRLSSILLLSARAPPRQDERTPREGPRRPQPRCRRPALLGGRSPSSPAPAAKAPSAAPLAALAGEASLVGLLGRRVAHRLVHGEDEAGRLGGGRERVALHHSRLPHKRLHRVAHAVLDNVDAVPLLPVRVLHPQLVEHIGRVHPRVGRDLPRDHLEALGVGADEQLLLAVNVPRLLAQEGGQLHLDGPAAGDDGRVLEQPARVHDGVVQRALCLLDELLGAAAQDEGAGGDARAPLEEVEALAANLLLLKGAARAEHIRCAQVVAGGLHLRVGCLRNLAQVAILDAAGAKQATVGKVLGGQVADGQLGKHDVGARRHDLGQLVVDDVPLGVHHLLVRGHVGHPHLGVVALGLELELDVEQHDLGVLEVLGHLLESGVREGLLERHAVDQH
mmetsp:Transcript_1025/g.3241  ORF Transcript_1025/g.3241 Transcript_1025/m.3241 type:complete len:391 (+) Transcript_1025:163-1335(+)|eukprot:scaffold8069_cov126-Isochrysis_galbana.AAC.14